MGWCSSFRKTLIVTFVIWLPSLASNHTDVTKATIKRNVSLTKCCKEHEVYVVGLDNCRRRELATKDLNGTKSFTLSTDNGGYRQVFDDEFDTTVNLTLCPEKYVAVSTFHYSFYENGSMHSATDAISFDRGQFCLHHSLPFGNYSARYCIEDHFLNQERVRKCCPINMAIYQGSCHLSSEPLTLIFNNHDDTHIGTGDPHDEHLPIQDSVTPHCSGRHRVLLHSNDYHLLPDGRLYTKNSSKLLPKETNQKIDEYCIDDMKLNSETVGN